MEVLAEIHDFTTPVVVRPRVTGRESPHVRGPSTPHNFELKQKTQLCLHTIQWLVRDCQCLHIRNIGKGWEALLCCEGQRKMIAYTPPCQLHATPTELGHRTKRLVQTLLFSWPSFHRSWKMPDQTNFCQPPKLWLTLPLPPHISLDLNSCLIRTPSSHLSNATMSSSSEIQFISTNWHSSTRPISFLSMFLTVPPSFSPGFSLLCTSQTLQMARTSWRSRAYARMILIQGARHSCTLCLRFITLTSKKSCACSRCLSWCLLQRMAKAKKSYVEGHIPVDIYLNAFNLLQSHVFWFQDVSKNTSSAYLSEELLEQTSSWIHFAFSLFVIIKEKHCTNPEPSHFNIKIKRNGKISQEINTDMYSLLTFSKKRDGQVWSPQKKK